MNPKVTASLFIVLLFLSFIFTGFLSFKGLCGIKSRFSLSSNQINVNCVCAGNVNVISDSEFHRYYCSGVNLSYVNAKLFSGKSQEIAKVFAKGTSVLTSKSYSLPNDIQYCEQDNDCIFVKNTCECGCAGSGNDYDLSISKKYQELWGKRLDCSESAVNDVCPQVSCPVARPVCLNNTCSDASIDLGAYLN